jgi:DNA-binding beta-propeller fold protein YncE
VLFAQPVEEAPSYVFYPPPPATPRIQFLGSYSSEHDLPRGWSPFTRFILGQPTSLALTKPYGVALHQDRLFVCDLRLPGVMVFDLRRGTLTFFGEQRDGRLQKPINIVIDEDGRRYVTDTLHRRVMIYDADGRYVSAFGDPEDWKPSGIALFEDRLYVSDVENGRVLVLDRESGEELQQIGRPGSGEGELVFPTNVALDSQGNLYVSDTGNARVAEFDAEGGFVRHIGSLGRGLGQLVRPKGVALDREGRIYIVDAAFQNLQIFDPEGKLLLPFGEAGNAPGGLNLPAQVAIDYEHVDLFADRVAPGYGLEYLIVVSSQFGLNKVNVYGLLKAAAEESG